MGGGGSTTNKQNASHPAAAGVGAHLCTAVSDAVEVGAVRAQRDRVGVLKRHIADAAGGAGVHQGPVQVQPRLRSGPVKHKGHL
jgi:hypothetical protein